MSNKSKRALMIRFSAMEDFLDLPSSAKGLLGLLAGRSNGQGLAHVTRNSICTCLNLAPMTAQAAVKALAVKEFAAQVGHGVFALNLTKVSAEERDWERDEAGEDLLAKFHRHTEGWAPSRARKSAAAKTAWTKNPRPFGKPKEGGDDGLVEEPSEPEDDGTNTTH